jgi:type II secretory pathway pseudopilin PulG
MRSQNARKQTQGLTIVELMIVISIILLLLITMLPAVRFAYKGRAIRESERQLNAFIGAAQAKAQRIGRPAGIWIERFSTGNIDGTGSFSTPSQQNYSQLIYHVETPLPYNGIIPGIRAKIFRVDLENQPFYFLDLLDIEPLTKLSNPIIRAGERFRIQFGRSGQFYEGIRLPTTNLERYPAYVNKGFTAFNSTDRTDEPGYLLIPDLGNDVRLPRSIIEGAGTSFTIHRSPRRSLGMPLNLPGSAAIDLSVSGFQQRSSSPNSGSEFLTNTAFGTQPVVVMFKPEGGIAYVQYHFKQEVPSGSIYLLIGKSDQVEVDKPNNTPSDSRLTKSETEQANLRDLKNRWIRIGFRDGSIRSNVLDHANGGLIKRLDDATGELIDNRTDVAAYPLPVSIFNSRKLVREAYTAGGD